MSGIEVVSTQDREYLVLGRRSLIYLLPRTRWSWEIILLIPPFLCYLAIHVNIKSLPLPQHSMTHSWWLMPSHSQAIEMSCTFTLFVLCAQMWTNFGPEISKSIYVCSFTFLGNVTKIHTFDYLTTWLLDYLTIWLLDYLPNNLPSLQSVEQASMRPWTSSVLYYYS